MKRNWMIPVFVLGSALSAPVMAGDAVVGAILGAGAGAAVGKHVGGSDGAMIGGAIGAITGVAIANSDRRDRVTVVSAPVYHAPPVVVRPRPVVVYPAPVVVRPAPVVYQPVVVHPGRGHAHGHYKQQYKHHPQYGHPGWQARRDGWRDHDDRRGGRDYGRDYGQGRGHDRDDNRRYAYR